MKIEMGESLFYSWLRHIKVCQMVQTNWTTSNKWPLCHKEKLEEIKQLTDNFFSTNYDYSIYKNNASLSQLLQQAECDVIGISIQNGSNKVYAVDVAFHENGLNYEMECLQCGKRYYANGSNISQKKCPACQGGKQ